VLTISANEELFYTRRLELPAGFLTMPWAEDTADSSAVDDGFTPVGEYVPDYSVGGESYGTDYSTPLTTIGHADSTGTQANLERAQRFLVEVQRSLDLWDRSWSHMPLNGLSVYAGERTTELAQWLGNATGHPVSGITLDPMVQGLDNVPAADRATCLVLLGVLMRTETRKL
jgi:MSHA biogenesis protein MshI